MFWWVIWWHDGQSKRPLRQDKHGHYFLISHLLFVLQYFYHNFESCCWTIYTNRKIILHDVFVQLQSIFNSTNINHGQFYPIFGFWLKYYIIICHITRRETRVITCAQPGSLKSLELCQKSSMVNHVSQQQACTHQTWPCLFVWFEKHSLTK